MSTLGDYGSAARSLAVNEPSPPSTPVLERGRPSWQPRRRSTAASLPTSLRPRSTRDELIEAAMAYTRWSMDMWNRLSWWQRGAGIAAAVVINVLMILFFVYNQAIMRWLHPKAVAWSEVTGGWLVVWAIIFVCAFPPMIGYSSMLTVSGFIYGVPKGWLVAASANVAGSFVAFVVCRRFFSGWVDRRFGHQTRFQAINLVLKHDGIGLLTMVRLCPLPYSTTNAVLSTFPTLTSYAFALATALASPKLVIHVFIGSRFNSIGDDDNEHDTTSKIINYSSIAFGVVLGVVTGAIIYRRTQARARELELEEQAKLEEREQALAHPDIFADDDDDEGGADGNAGIRENENGDIQAHTGDDIDFLDPYDGGAAPYRDDDAHDTDK